MSAQDHNPPAFPGGWPEAGYEPHYGMTLRDWFAGQALSNPAICTASSEYPHLDAYAFADAMLAERGMPPLSKGTPQAQQ